MTTPIVSALEDNNPMTRRFGRAILLMAMWLTVSSLGVHCACAQSPSSSGTEHGSDAGTTTPNGAARQTEWSPNASQWKAGAGSFGRAGESSWGAKSMNSGVGSAGAWGSRNARFGYGAQPGGVWRTTGGPLSGSEGLGRLGEASGSSQGTGVGVSPNGTPSSSRVSSLIRPGGLARPATGHASPRASSGGSRMGSRRPAGMGLATSRSSGSHHQSARSGVRPHRAANSFSSGTGLASGSRAGRIGGATNGSRLSGGLQPEGLGPLSSTSSVSALKGTRRGGSHR